MTRTSASAKTMVAAHHGSMSRKLRLEAERKLKEGPVRVLVATASLELGIDVGTIDLVCQSGSPRSIAVGAAARRAARGTGVEPFPRDASSPPRATNLSSAPRWCVPFASGISTG